MRECKYDVKDICLSFSLEYIPEEIIMARNLLLKFYEGGMTAEYLNSLTVEEFIMEKKSAEKIAELIKKEINSGKKKNG